MEQRLLVASFMGDPIFKREDKLIPLGERVEQLCRALKLQDNDVVVLSDEPYSTPSLPPVLKLQLESVDMDPNRAETAGTEAVYSGVELCVDWLLKLFDKRLPQYIYVSVLRGSF